MPTRLSPPISPDDAVEHESALSQSATAQPPEAAAIEVLNFKDPGAGKVGPVALQMHNAGLFDEFKAVTIEPDPKDDRLITVK